MWHVRGGGQLTLRPAPALNLALEPGYVRTREPRQYIATIPGGSPATYGGRYVFGRIERSTVFARVRVNYTFAPRLTLEAYAEPFAASGRYGDIGELVAARGADLRVYGTDGTSIGPQLADGFEVTDHRNGQQFLVPRPDFSALSFRSNVVLRWEWQPGSTLFLVWQQSRSSVCSIGDPSACPPDTVPGRLVGPSTLGSALRAPGDTFLAIKASYWLSIQ
jgi:hypothetical protein